METETSLIDSNGFTVIRDHEYFCNLDTFADNFEGTCGFVALGMILGYLDTYHNPYTIPHMQAWGRDDNNNYTLEYLLEKSNSQSISPDDKSSTHITDWGSLPGSNQSLHDILLSYGHYWWHTSESTPTDGLDIEATFLDYKNDYIPEEYDDYFEAISGKYFFTHAKPKELIDEGNPTIIVMTAYEYDDHGTIESEGLSGAHVVVAYGYKDDKFLTHFGWRPFDSRPGNYFVEIVVNSATIHSYCAIKYTGPHFHSDNLPWNYDGCSGFYCPCGHFECDHANHSISQKSELFHTIECEFCGPFDQEHTFSKHTVNGVESIVCDICGYQKTLNDIFNLDCRTTEELTINLSIEETGLYKINIDCETYYDFIATSSNQVNVILFDTNMNVINDEPNIFLYDNLYYTTLFNVLPIGEYHIMFNYTNPSSSGELEIEFGPHNSSYREEIIKGTSKDALVHLWT